MGAAEGGRAGGRLSHPVEERHLAETELLPRLDAVLAAIAEGVVFLVDAPGGGTAFVLGPPALLGRVVGLVDDEYGWPTPVDLAAVRSVEDLAPGRRAHPFVHRDGACVAVAVSPWEWEQIRARSG